LTCDNLDNRLVRATLEQAPMMEVTASTRRSLMEHRQLWSALAGLVPAGAQQFALARRRYTRLSEHYRLAHALGELIFLGRRPGAPFDAGAVTTGGLTLDMADLFERFVQRLLSEGLAAEGLRVRTQGADHGAILDRDGFVYRRVRPDLVVYRRNVPVAVVDAKYKDYWRASTGSQYPCDKVSNEDLYQLFFYAQRLQLRHALPAPPPAVIVAPLPAADERDAPMVGPRHTHLQWRAGAAEASQLRLLFAPMTDVLRAIARGSRVPAPCPVPAAALQWWHDATIS
jgi:5-methylcytosine-specific restriction endonuclease McrBC regulatory subunit McrC